MSLLSQTLLRVWHKSDITVFIISGGYNSIYVTCLSVIYIAPQQSPQEPTGKDGRINSCFFVWLIKYETVLLHFAVVLVSVFVDSLTHIFQRVTSLALGQSHDCPSASEASLMDMGKIYHYQTTTRHIRSQSLHGQTDVMLTICQWSW